MPRPPPAGFNWPAAALGAAGGTILAVALALALIPKHKKAEATQVATTATPVDTAAAPGAAPPAEPTPAPMTAAPATAAPFTAGFNMTACDGTQAETRPTTVPDGLTVSPIRRGPGLAPITPDQVQFFNHGVGNYTVPRQSADVAEAVSQEQYLTFTVAPAAGRVMSLDEVKFAVWCGHPGKLKAAVAYSTDGTNFGQPVGVSGDIADGVNIPHDGMTGSRIASADFRAVPELRAVRGPVTVRIYLLGTDGQYDAIGIGRTDSDDDLTVTGTVSGG